MKIERQAAMVKSVAKNMKTKEKKEAKSDKIRDNLYKVMSKLGKSLDEIKKADLTEKDYKIVLDYYEVVRGYSPFMMMNLEQELNQ